MNYKHYHNIPSNVFCFCHFQLILLLSYVIAFFSIHMEDQHFMYSVINDNRVLPSLHCSYTAHSYDLLNYKIHMYTNMHFGEF